MTGLALTLVLLAAVLHPAWNVLAKRATSGDPITFVWLTSALSAVLYVPLVIVLVTAAHQHLRDGWIDLAMIAGTGVLHVVYFLLLQRGYRVGSFSVVYPLARGTGPLVTTLAAVALFGERLAAWQLLGVGIVVAAIFVIAGGPGSKPATGAGRAATLRLSLAYGVATGCAIAAYTLWDKAAVAALAISPILYDFGRTAAQTLLLGPQTVSSPARRALLRETWNAFRREALGVAVLSPLAYVLVLYALQSAPVGIVAPVRESSIVIGAVMGARFFSEGNRIRTSLAAVLMLAGIVALTRG